MNKDYYKISLLSDLIRTISKKDELLQELDELEKLKGLPRFKNEKNDKLLLKEIELTKKQFDLIFNYYETIQKKILLEMGVDINEWIND